MQKELMKVNELTACYKDKKIINNISFSIMENSINAFLFPNKEGKTTFIKTISGIKKYDKGEIIIDDVLLPKGGYGEYGVLISTILEDINNQFLCDYVYDEIRYPLVNLGYSNKEIKNMIDDVVSLMGISGMLYKKIVELSYIEKIQVLLAASIVHKPKILFIDDIFRFLNNIQKEKLFKVIKKINKEFNISILYTTSDINDVIDVNHVFVIKNGRLIMKGPYSKIILRDNELSKMGFTIPIMIDLSRKLQFYDLVDQLYYDPDKVVDALWK